MSDNPIGGRDLRPKMSHVSIQASDYCSSKQDSQTHKENGVGGELEKRIRASTLRQFYIPVSMQVPRSCKCPLLPSITPTPWTNFLTGAPLGDSLWQSSFSILQANETRRPFQLIQRRTSFGRSNTSINLLVNKSPEESLFIWSKKYLLRLKGRQRKIGQVQKNGCKKTGTQFTPFLKHLIL